MTKEQFDKISNLTQQEYDLLDDDTKIEYLKMLKETNNQKSNNSVPTETYVELGANMGIDIADTVTGTSKTVSDIVSKKTTDTLTGTQTAIVYLKMTQSIYSIVKGDFKWDLLNTVTLLSSTLACLTGIGINIACMSVLTTILASNPFSFGLAVIVSIINYFSIGDQLAKLKKQYMTCYNSYRRIKKLCVLADTNEIIYTNINRVISGCQEKVKSMIQYLTENEDNLKNIMSRKIFIGAEFNSFVLFTNIITFIQSKQDLSTTREGVYNDYIDFCSIEDYIDTYDIVKQDKFRIEYYILQGDTYGLKNFTIALDYLKGFFSTYKLKSNLTKQTKSDIEYVIKCINILNDYIGTQNLVNLEKDNEKFLDSRNPEELFNSIYSYLIYSESMKNSPFQVCNTLLNKEYYKDLSIYEYVSAFNEYPVFLFSKWFFYFGNIMYNDIYIENYKNEMIESYNKDKSLYDYTFMKDLTDNINTFNDYKIVLLWLFSIREFLQNIVDRNYENYNSYYATSFTQTAIDKDGKTLYNYYLPNNSYVFKDLQRLIKKFKDYMKQYGYDKNKFSYLLDNFWLFNNYDTKISVPFISLDCINYLEDTEGLLGKFGNINDTLKSLANQQYGWNNKIKDNPSFLIGYIQYKNNGYTPLLKNASMLNYSNKPSVNNDGNRAFGRKEEFNINDIVYYGTCENEKDFFTKILLKNGIRYLFIYMILIFDGRWSADWGNNTFMEILYLLTKSQQLRDLFFNGYTFTLTNNKEEYLKSLWEFITDKREDIIFYWADNGLKEFNIETVVNDMLNNSNYKIKIKELYNGFKFVYNDYISTINLDIRFATNMINEQIANFESILDKYVKYDSSLSYAYTDKNNSYLWNLYKTARDLGVNNKGYITNIPKHLVPVYKLEDDGTINLETYYPPMFILMFAQDDTNLSQAYYLFNKNAIDSLFKIGNEKFKEKVNEFKELVDLSIQPIVAEINHNKILENLKNEIENSYNLTYDELIERLGTQEDEYILMENLTNTEILKQENMQVNKNNELLAQQTQNNINNIKSVLDNKSIIKYTILGGIGFIVAKILKGGK